MKIIVFLITVLTVCFSCGCTSEQSKRQLDGQMNNNSQETAISTQDQQIIEEKEKIINIARIEIKKMGLALPNETGKEALEAIGAKVKIMGLSRGWKVEYPLGNPWAVSWVYLEMDSSGKVLQHRFLPGQ